MHKKLAQLMNDIFEKYNQLIEKFIDTANE